MSKLVIKFPEALEIEFATVALILNSGFETRTIDALILSLVKYEKQLRRLYFFLVRENSNLKELEIEMEIGGNKSLFAGNFMEGVARISGHKISDVIGGKFNVLNNKMVKLNGRRNKLIHGQRTGAKLGSDDLVAHIKDVVDWMNALSIGAAKKFNFDGVNRIYPKRKLISNGGEPKLNKLADLQSQIEEISKPKYRKNTDTFP